MVTTDPAHRPFSTRWVWMSMFAFIAAEIVVGGVLGELILGRMLSMNTSFLLQGLLNMAGFVIGGFAIGLLSPGRRIAEPAVGAACTMMLLAVTALFVPYRFLGYSSSGFIVAAAIAAALGAGGAFSGEKLTGNLPAAVDRGPQDTL